MDSRATALARVLFPHDHTLCCVAFLLEHAFGRVADGGGIVEGGESSGLKR